MPRFKKEILNYFTIDTLPNDDLKDVARFCGIDTAIKLLNTEELVGQRIYIPRSISPVMFNQIRKDMYTLTIDEIATRLHLSKSTVYSFIEKHY